MSALIGRFIDSRHPCTIGVVMLMVLLEEQKRGLRAFVLHTAGK